MDLTSGLQLKWTDGSSKPSRVKTGSSAPRTSSTGTSIVDRPRPVSLGAPLKKTAPGAPETRPHGLRSREATAPATTAGSELGRSIGQSSSCGKETEQPGPPS